MWTLHLRLWLLLTLLFGLIYAVLTVVGTQLLHVGGLSFYIILSLVMMFIQYLVSPKIVEWTMRVSYLRRQDYPRLFEIVEDLSGKAGIPVPKIGLARMDIPNAFAFGRSIRDGRVCVTQGILNLLDEQELKAVLGHELSHLKNRDVLTITVLSVIPILMYRIAWHLLFYGRRRDDRGGNSALIGMVAFLFYFITNLLVLYASRIREYFADRGSVLLGNKPETLASSLYKLVYGSARMNRQSLKEAEGLKAFFINDPSQALKEIRDLAQLDRDKNGTFDRLELASLRNKQVRLGFGDRLMEVLSTHPNMLKRIKQLSKYRT
jgi:heat shock protein HtpX